MNDLEYAKELLNTSKYTCVLCKGNIVHTSTQTGIAPLVELLAAGVKLRGFSAADRIVGKAVALLFVLGGIEKIYSPTMSETAAEVFLRYGIWAEYTNLVPKIINRNGTGSCPMEQAVSNIDDPSQVLQVLQNTLTVLQTKRKDSIK